MSPFDILDQAARKVSKPSISSSHPVDSAAANNTAGALQGTSSSPSHTSPTRQIISDSGPRDSDDNQSEPFITQPQPWVPQLVTTIEDSQARPSLSSAPINPTWGATVTSGDSSALSSPKPKEDNLGREAGAELVKGMARYYAAKAREAGSRLVILWNTQSMLGLILIEWKRGKIVPSQLGR
jgi:hypothetical protein